MKRSACVFLLLKGQNAQIKCSRILLLIAICDPSWDPTDPPDLAPLKALSWEGRETRWKLSQSSKLMSALGKFHDGEKQTRFPQLQTQLDHLQQFNRPYLLPQPHDWPFTALVLHGAPLAKGTKVSVMYGFGELNFPRYPITVASKASHDKKWASSHSPKTSSGHQV